MRRYLIAAAFVFIASAALAQQQEISPAEIALDVGGKATALAQYAKWEHDQRVTAQKTAADQTARADGLQKRLDELQKQFDELKTKH